MLKMLKEKRMNECKKKGGNNERKKNIDFHHSAVFDKVMLCRRLRIARF